VTFDKALKKPASDTWVRKKGRERKRRTIEYIQKRHTVHFKGVIKRERREIGKCTVALVGKKDEIVENRKREGPKSARGLLEKALKNQLSRVKGATGEAENSAPDGHRRDLRKTSVSAAWEMVRRGHEKAT